MWLSTKVSRNRSSKTVPAEIAARVTSTRTGPGHTFDDASFPCVEIESEESTTASTSAPIPYSAIRRACVDENKETTKTKSIGLISQIGSALAPPGFPIKALRGPPPEISNPGSTNSRLGLVIASSEKGTFMMKGTKIKAARFCIRNEYKGAFASFACFS